jgi:hypothetical protein
MFGRRADWDSWVDDLTIIFWSALVMSLIAFVYLALTARYQFSPSWKDAAMIVMFASVPIAVGGFSNWRKFAFWIALLISSVLHLFLVHAWIINLGPLTAGRRGTGSLAWVLGFALFFVVLAAGWMVKKRLGQVKDTG